MPVREFARTHLQRSPFARPGAARSALALLDWDTLDRVLGARPEVLVAKEGRLVQAPVPRDLAAARRLMSQGLGLVVRRSEHYDPGLAGLAQAFARELPGQVQIQLYATPAGTQTFGWHFDFEDVFIAQTNGVKDYYFRENTLFSEFAPGTQPDFSRIREETSPLFCSRLLAADWLYIPARWWHLVSSVEHALSISIGVIPRPLTVTPTSVAQPCSQSPR
jgi:ribosomal protein L16 Arg81 hydroxylase